MEQFTDDQYCFACGVRNPHGLHLKFKADEESGDVYAEVDFAKHFQGWQGVLHGGLISTTLDEVMIKAAFHKGYKCVTAELNVRFKKPALLKKSFTVKGKLVDVNRRVVRAESFLIDSDNVVVATASGKLFTVE